MPDKEWLDKFQQVRELTLSPVALDQYFEKEEIAGRQLAVLDIGPCTLPTGKLLVRDPLVYLGRKNEQPYLRTAPAGTYTTQLCVVKPQGEEDARYAAARLCFTAARPVKFYEALIGTEHLEELNGENYFGFNADAGLGCICDQEVHGAYCAFLDRWEKENPGKNLYHDYFQDLFAQSAQSCPEYQREGGDWINWQIPGTEYHLPFFQSGFGDGVYPVYWGCDEEGSICQLVVQCIDIELAYGEK